MTREELKALKHIEDRINWLETESQDELERVGYTVKLAVRDATFLRSLLSLARRVPVMEEALRPFAEAADSIDKETPPNLRCPEDMSIGDAVWERDQPIVHDLRRARAALQSIKDDRR